ncbi:MFS transporter [Parvularcula sp. IMCC14364]|uniref:spinster family MFS transporter n=1 Tax=Parvularcula sp. IMCC14364 TaxID=3067902 RepID=UPI002740A883|nr:MFS transporter [Parvularcula sp. IMCC14364]
MSETPQGQANTKYRTYVLILLTLVYMFNFIDRQIIGILSPFIKEDLDLTDAQLGFLKGFAFALFYTIMGIPIAWLADRFNRVTIVSVSLALWSAFTAASGVAGNYTQLALARIGVGVGEAGGSPPSHSMISDFYSKEERAGALAIYSLGIPFGIMMAYFASAFLLGGGLGENTAGWRTVMILLGIPGVLFALIVKLTIKEPPRAKAPSSDPIAKVNLSSPFVLIAAISFVNVVIGLVFSILYWEPISSIQIGVFSLPGWMSLLGTLTLVFSLYRLVFIQDFYPPVKTLLSIPSWWGMCMGIAWVSFATYAVGAWGIDYVSRAFPEADLLKFLVIFGIINGTTYAGGTWFGGYLTDKLGKKDKGAYAFVPAVGVLVAIPVLVFSMWTGSLVVHVGCIAVFLFVLGFYLGPSFSVAQTLAPVNVRAMSTALFFFILNIIALGGGPTFVGLMSEALSQANGDETQSLRIALTFLAIPMIISLFAFYWTSKKLPEDWIKAEERNKDAVA